MKDGKLYVNGVLLEDSPMKDHPLNPMRDSRLKYLMERQSRYPALTWVQVNWNGGSGLTRNQGIIT